MKIAQFILDSNYGKYLFVFFLIVVPSVFGGGDGDKDNTNVDDNDGLVEIVELDEPMDPEIEEYLASLPAFDIDKDLIVFDDGETFGEYYSNKDNHSQDTDMQNEQE